MSGAIGWYKGDKNMITLAVNKVYLSSEGRLVNIIKQESKGLFIGRVNNNDNTAKVIIFNADNNNSVSEDGTVRLVRELIEICGL